MKKSRVGSSSSTGPMIPRKTSGMAGAISAKKVNSDHRKIKIDSDMSNLKWIEKVPDPIVMVQEAKEPEKATMGKTSPKVPDQADLEKRHGYEERLMIPIGVDWINPDILEKYQKEYQVLGDRQIILETNYEDSIKNVESIQGEISECLDRLKRLTLSQAEIEQKIAFYVTQRDKVTGQVQQLQDHLRERQSTLRQETDCMNMTKSSLEAVKRNHGSVKEHLFSLVRQTQKTLDSLKLE